MGFRTSESQTQKLICRALGEDPKRVIRATEEELSAISGVGGVIAGTFVEYFKDTAHVDVFDRLLKEVELTKETSEEDQKFAGVKFCHYRQRRAFCKSGTGKRRDCKNEAAK